MEDKRPKVGMGVFIIKDGKVLFGKRKGNGEGLWCPPGGHLEFGESVEEGMIREAFEETGIKIKNLRLGPYTNDYSQKDNTHYITLYGTAEIGEGEPELTEPDEFYEWQWFDWNSLPAPRLLSIDNFIAAGYNPLDY
jgi:8-oxo-dGTP diphosphatase